MYKQFIIIIILFSNLVCKSQNLKCTYSVRVDSVYFLKNKLPVDNLYKYMDFVDELFYSLEISDSISVYKISDYSKKRLSGMTTRIAQNIGGRGLYYSNIKDSIFLNQKEFFGETFLINQTIPEWNLLSESKFIDNIETFKANCAITINNGVKKFRKIITAWYAPSIPVTFGPKNYNGLPGLILELHENEVVLYLSKIEFEDSDKSKLISKPSKGVRMTELEFENHLIENQDYYLKSILKN